MTKTIVIKNPTDSQVNILLPKYRIDLKIGPKSESDPLSEVLLKHIQPYVKAFNLEVVQSDAQVVAEAKVVPQVAAPAPAPVQEPKAPEATVEAPKTEVTEQPAADTAEGTEVKTYAEGELYGLLKGDLVAICTSKGLDPAGTKDELVARILESQAG